MIWAHIAHIGPLYLNLVSSRKDMQSCGGAGMGGVMEEAWI